MMSYVSQLFFHVASGPKFPSGVLTDHLLRVAATGPGAELKFGIPK